MLELFILVFLGSVAGIIGGVVLLFKKEWAGKLSKYAIPLAAGVLLSVSLVDILPHAVEEIDNTAFYIVLFIFIFTFLMEKFIFPLHHHEHKHRHHSMRVESSVPMVIAGDTIHNFLDGVAITAAYFVDPKLGLLVALSTFLHEVPHEIADFGILLKAGWSRTDAFLANLCSALATFPGAFAVILFARFNETYIGALMAISAGLFLYVATTDFMPHFGNDEDGLTKKEILFFLVGTFIIVIATLLIPHEAH